MSRIAVNYDISNFTEILIKEHLISCSRIQTFPSVGIFYGKNPLDYPFSLLLVELSMVVMVTQIVHQSLKPLKQPTIIAEIIGGIIVGQIAIRSGSNFSKNVFPPDARFVLRNIGLLGFMCFLFISGVKIDVGLIKKAGRNQWLIAIVSVLVPMICGLSASIVVLKGSSIEGGQHFAALFGVTALFSVTAFPVLNPIIKEMNLLSSEIGRLSVSLALISVVMGINCAVIFESAHQGSRSLVAGVCSLLSFLFLIIGIFVGIRRVMCELVKGMPQGKPIPEGYVIGILLGVMVSGFLSDALGMALCNGPMWFGLAIPDGPPLGAILEEKIETFVNDFLMPLGYVFLGMTIELPFIEQQWFVMKSFVYVSLLVVLAKTIATFSTSYFVDLPIKDALAISLLLNLRGQMEILLLLRFVDLRMLTAASASVVVFIILVVNAISVIGITFLHDPTKPYMVNKRRTIQHNPQNSELRIVACFFDDSSVIGLLNILELSSPSRTNSPICIYALHLMELVAQAQPIQIEHNMDDLQQQSSIQSSSLIRVLDRFKNSKRKDIEIHPFTIITAKKTMYQDICQIALDKRASLIVLPMEQPHNVIHTQISVGQSTTRNYKKLNNDVLHNAPCSVAIFTNTSYGSSENNLLRKSHKRSGECYVNVLFTGGADSREALSYADRIIANKKVYLTLIRFLSCDQGDNKLEKKLDDALITWFWVKHRSNHRVFYREFIVSSATEIISSLKDLASDNCKLYIVGRMHGINPMLLQGIVDWTENNVLGPLGDYIASSEIGKKASVIVMQQQILRV